MTVIASLARRLKSGTATSSGGLRKRISRAVTARVPAATPPPQPGPDVSAELQGSAVRGRDLPAEGGQLPGDGNCDHGAALAALVIEPLPALVQAALGSPGSVDDARVMTALPTRELGGHPRWIAVLPGRLYRQAPRVLGPGPGDRSLPALLTGRLFAGHHAEVACQQTWVRETAEVTPLGRQPNRGEGVDAAQASQAADRDRLRGGLGDLGQRLFELVTPGQHRIVRVEGVFESEL